MKNKEYEQLPKKDSKSLHLILGIVIGAVIATAIILVVLFATGVIGEKGSEETATTTAATNSLEISDAEKNTKPSDGGQPNASEGMYREFSADNVSFVYFDKSPNNVLSEEKKSTVIHVPYMKEFEELGLELNSLEIDTKNTSVHTNGDITLVFLYVFNKEQSIPLIAIAYSASDKLTYDNILMLYADCWFTDPETGLKKGFDGRYLGTDELIWTTVCTDGENEIGYGLTNSGYSIKNGTCYDNNGNIITEKAYQEELNRIDEEVFEVLASQGFNF